MHIVICIENFLLKFLWMTIWQKFQIQGNQMRVTNQQIRQVCKMKAEGKTHRVIGRAVGISASTVHSILVKYYYNNKANKAHKSKEPRVLLFDIETAPAISYHWGRWKVNVGVSQVIQRPYVITWAAKWLGSPTIFSDSLPFYKTFAKDEKDDINIVKSLWKMLDEADIVIAHYGKKFDIPQMNARFVKHGLPQPSPYRVIDTKEMASKFFKFEANSLAELADFLEVDSGNKNKTDFDTWRDCVEGKGTPKAWDTMLTYNEQDVNVLEDVYLKLRPYANNHPNISVFYEGDDMRCTVCGSKSLTELSGNAYTNVSKFKSYRCKCGHVQRGRKNLRSKDQMKSTLANALS